MAHFFERNTFSFKVGICLSSAPGTVTVALGAVLSSFRSFRKLIRTVACFSELTMKSFFSFSKEVKRQSWSESVLKKGPRKRRTQIFCRRPSSKSSKSRRRNWNLTRREGRRAGKQSIWCITAIKMCILARERSRRALLVVKDCPWPRARSLRARGRSWVRPCGRAWWMLSGWDG